MSPNRGEGLLASRCTVALLLVLPWLNPFASGPSTAAIPWLVSLACAAASLLLWSWSPVTLARPFALAWLAAALLSSMMGLLQYFGIAGALAPWVNHNTLGDAFANLRQRNQFATLTNLGLAVLLWGPLAQRRAPARVRADVPPAGAAHRYWPFAAAMLLAFGNAASGSRTGLLQFLALAPMALLWNGTRHRRTWQVLAVAALAYVAAAIALPALIGLDPLVNGITGRLRFDSLPCASRWVIWQNVLYLITQRPLAGWGWGELDFAHFVTLYPGARFCEILDNAHNLPLQLAVELGIPLAVLACGLGIGLAWRARPWRESNPDRQLAWAVLALILLHSMLEYPLWYGPFQIAVASCLWLLWSTRQPAHAGSASAGALQARAPTNAQVRPFRPLPMAASVLCLLGVAYAAWDYHRVSQIYLPTEQRAADYREDTLQKIRGSWLFRNQVRFAEFTTTELTPDNAAYLHAMAQELLHFSPEARVAEKLIESAVMLGRADEALFYLARYRAAFPQEHARWAKAGGASAGAPTPAD